jgi:hypothetical protein
MRAFLLDAQTLASLRQKRQSTGTAGETPGFPQQVLA